MFYPNARLKIFVILMSLVVSKYSTYIKNSFLHTLIKNHGDVRTKLAFIYRILLLEKYAKWQPFGHYTIGLSKISRNIVVTH